MNNDQFRRLVQQQSSSPSTAVRAPSSTPRSKDAAAATPSVLGSRMRSSIPMTPRSVIGSSGVDFARQLREANAPPPKKFKSSAAPKGTKLANGYVDRTQLRSSAEEDEKASRVKALEEMVKLGQMEYSTFEKLRDEIVGGDVGNVHLVKGLDRRLLERARRGEDVYKEPEKKVEEKVEEEEERMAEVDVDAALDDLEGREVAPIIREKKKENDSQAVMAKKRTRDDILEALKASRAQVQATAAPALGIKFRKLSARLEPGTSRVEIDNKGREVLITVDEDGNVKRKVRKKKPTPESSSGEVTKNGLLMPDKNAIPLGADAPIIPQKPTPAAEPSDDEDVFEGVGADYDPLTGSDGSDSDSSTSESGEKKGELQKRETKHEHNTSPQTTVSKDPKNMPPPPLPSKPRNYFASTSTTSEENNSVTNPLKDPTFLAALQKANSITRTAPDEDDSGSDAESQREAARKAARRKEMLEAHDRDAEDMDLGFGGSRFGDQEEGEERAGVKLSKWDGDADDGGKNDRGGTKQRKRGKKKKKGDKDSASDVLAVLEKRGRG